MEGLIVLREIESDAFATAMVMYDFDVMKRKDRGCIGVSWMSQCKNWFAELHV